MPTMDLDASVRAVCGRDPRFRPEAYHFLLEALDFTLTRRAREAGAPPAPAAAPAAAPPATRGHAVPAPSNVAGKDLLEGFRDLALERFGALAHEVLRVWGITRTDDVGAVVFNMVEAGLLQKTASDSPADYHAVFDFEATLQRAFADRLRNGEVRLDGGGMTDGMAGERGPAPADARRRTLYLTGVGVVVLYLAYLARAAVVPLLIALIAAYVLAPLVAALQKRGFSRIWAVTTLFIAFFGSFGVAAAFGIPPLVHEARDLVRAAVGEPARTLGMALPAEIAALVDAREGEKAPTFAALLEAREALPPEHPDRGEPAVRGNFERKLREVQEAGGEAEAAKFRDRHGAWLLARYGERIVLFDDRNGNGTFDPGYLFEGTLFASRWVGERVRNPDAAALVEDLGIDVFPDLSESFLAHTGDVALGALGVLGTLFTLLSWGVIVPLYAFYFLLRLEGVWNAFVTYLPGSHRDRVLRVLFRIHVMLLGFFRGRILTMFIKGVMVALGLAVVGTPYWAVFGVLAGILTIVPVVGPLAAGLPAAILSFSEGGPVTAGLAVGVLVLADVVEGYVLIPKMVGKEVGLHPMAVITAILVGGALLGVFGVVIAIPLAAAVNIVWGEFVVPALKAKAAEAPRDPGTAIP